ncbi:MAG: EamA family transporter [Ignavibacteriales bacterium]|nr:EamA family transporter [Ignavibacteriales bacterium]
MPPRPGPAKGYLFLLIAVLFWGGSASLAKFLFTTRFDPLIITQTRSSLSFILIALFFLFRDRSVFRVDRSDLPKFVLAGIFGISVTNYAYYYTVQEATIATAILVQYTAPVLVMIYAVAVSREEVLTGAKIIALALSLTGCWLAVSGGDWNAIRLSGWTVVSGGASAVCYAFMLLISKHLLKRYSVWTFLTYAFGFSTLFWLFVNTPWEIAVKGYHAADWGIFWMFAVVSILIPHAAFTMGLKLLEATTVGIATTLEPVVAILVAFLTLGESLDGIQLLGAAFVVSAVLLLQVRIGLRKIPAREVNDARR